MSSIFVTGGSGFLGGRLLSSLSRSGHRVIALDRSGAIATRTPETQLEIHSGDLLDPDTYREPLERSRMVVHLAALTGRGSRQQHYKTNLDATRRLVETSRAAGVQEFLFVSTIASKFADKRSYHYAQAKEAAETLVRDSGMRFAIVRPTIIVGRGSAVLAALEKLAGLPIVPVFGSGKTLVQPIYIDDVVKFILDIINDGLFQGQTWEFGGPSRLTVEELLQRIRGARGRNRARTVHLPVTLFAGLLRLAERAGASAVLPVTAGQLTTFHQDGTIESNPLFERRRTELVDIPEMLTRSLVAG